MRRASATLASTPCWVNWPPLRARDSSSAFRCLSLVASLPQELPALQGLCLQPRQQWLRRDQHRQKTLGFSIDSNVNGVSTDLRSRFLDGSNQAVEPYCRTTSDDPSSRILKG